MNNNNLKPRNMNKLAVFILVVLGGIGVEARDADVFWGGVESDTENLENWVKEEEKDRVYNEIIDQYGKDDYEDKAQRNIQVSMDKEGVEKLLAIQEQLIYVAREQGVIMDEIGGDAKSNRLRGIYLRLRSKMMESKEKFDRAYEALGSGNAVSQAQMKSFIQMHNEFLSKAGRLESFVKAVQKYEGKKDVDYWGF